MFVGHELNFTLKLGISLSRLLRMRFGAIITSEKEFLRAVSNRHIFGTLLFFNAKLEKKKKYGNLD